MKRRLGPTLVTLVAAVLAGTVLWNLPGTDSSVVRAADKGPAAARQAPVESDMHEFMEYVFQPTYKQLRAGMAGEPTDKPGWKTIKSNSLILAESANLLLIRSPEKQADDWNGTSVAVRQHGGELYRAAAKKDFAAAQKHYKKMLDNCNACHKTFAEGKYQLSP